MASNEQRTHRPRAPWHDYKTRGIYLITIVVRNRERILGELNMDAKNPAVILSETGKAVEREWKKTVAIQALNGRKIKLLHYQVMPDHFHGIVFVEEDMDVSVGSIINKYKNACTREWRLAVAKEMQEEADRGLSPGLTRGSNPEPNPTSTTTPKTTSVNSGDAYKNTMIPDIILDTITPEDWEKYRKINHVSVNKRPAIYSTLPRILQPLFADDYDDTILYKRGQLQHMIDYVMDNPRRAIIMKLNKDIFQRLLKVEINGRIYGAFGNMFLLKWPHKVAVWFHRHEQSPENLRLPMGHRIKYESTEQFAKEREELNEMANEGSAIVTAGISKGEQIIKKDCFENGYRMIHIQKEPITDFWKPEKLRFEICGSGKLLILAPLDIEAMPDVNGVKSSEKYSQFHNLNTIAQEIAEFHGTAYIKRH